MDIASAKQQIKNTVQIYLQKDALGRNRLAFVFVQRDQPCRGHPKSPP